MGFFASRTLEGLGALNSAITTKPERVAFIAASAVNVVSSAFGWEKPRKAAKTVLMPLLGASVVRRRKELPPTTTATLLTGITAGWIGDLVLMAKESSLAMGAIPFTVNHLANMSVMVRHGARPNVARVAARVPLMLGSIIMAKKVKPEYVPLVCTYGTFLGVSSILADDRTLVADAGPVVSDKNTDMPLADARYGLGHGANLFLISDGLLMACRIAGEDTVLGKLLNAAVMDTYICAQLLLTEGLMALEATDA